MPTDRKAHKALGRCAECSEKVGINPKTGKNYRRCPLHHLKLLKYCRDRRNKAK